MPATGMRAAVASSKWRLVQVSCGWPRVGRAFDRPAGAHKEKPRHTSLLTNAGGKVFDGFAAGSVAGLRLAEKRRSRVDGQACPSTLLLMVRPPARSPYETSTNRHGLRAGPSLGPQRAFEPRARTDPRRLVQVSCGWPRVARASDLRVLALCPASGRRAPRRPRDACAPHRRWSRVPFREGSGDAKGPKMVTDSVRRRVRAGKTRP